MVKTQYVFLHTIIMISGRNINACNWNIFSGILCYLITNITKMQLQKKKKKKHYADPGVSGCHCV